MALVDMKYVPDDKAPAPTYAGDKEAYPYSLQISLDNDDLTKLGITDLPEMGEVMTLNAKIKVIRIQDEQLFYGRCRCLGLQITDMELKEIGNEADEKY